MPPRPKRAKGVYFPMAIGGGTPLSCFGAWDSTSHKPTPFGRLIHCVPLDDARLCCKSSEVGGSAEGCVALACADTVGDMHRTIETLVGLRQRVGRRTYIGWGLGLAVAKFVVDTAVVYGFSHKTWSPLGYVVPSLRASRASGRAGARRDDVLLVVLAMPFLWIGLSMSVRRAADAGLSPWIGAGFLVPILNYVTMPPVPRTVAKTAPAGSPAGHGAYRAPGRDDAAALEAWSCPSAYGRALLGVLASIAVGLAMLGLSVYGLGLYGTALFFVDAVRDGGHHRRPSTTQGPAPPRATRSG